MTGGGSVVVCLLVTTVVLLTFLSLATDTADIASTVRLSVCKELRAKLQREEASDDDSINISASEQETFECYVKLLNKNLKSLDDVEEANEVTQFFLSTKKMRERDWTQTAKVFMLNVLSPKEEADDGVKLVDSLLFYETTNHAKLAAGEIRLLLKELLSLETRMAKKMEKNAGASLRRRLANLFSRAAELVIDHDCDSAGAAFQVALKWDPSNPIANWGYGVYLIECSSSPSASQKEITGVAHLRKAIDTKKNYGEAHKALGSYLTKKGEVEEARHHFLRSAWIYPRSLDSPINDSIELGSRHKVSLEDIPYKRGLMMSQLLELQLCYEMEDKKNSDERFARLYAMIDIDLKRGDDDEPWTDSRQILLLPLGKRYAKRVAEREAKWIASLARTRLSTTLYPTIAPSPYLPLLSPKQFTTTTVKRVGYLSDGIGMRDYSLDGVMQALAEGHNKRGVWEAHCIQIGHHEESIDSEQYRKGCKYYHDITHMKSWEAASYIRKLSLNILVDLVGHGPESAMGVLSYQPAPIQMSLLGWPSTTGASYIQYYIADPVSIPPEMSLDEFTEKIIFLPHSSQFGAHSKTAMFDTNVYRLPTREEESLPTKGFVFCNHGDLAKMDVVVLRAWLEILEKVPNSALWLHNVRDTINHVAKVFHDHGYTLSTPEVITPSPLSSIC
eukprot:TRINITY_DN3455_c0_g1_i2.p1 TRINITY_DN3455_c0_g1~~TRINITY_DN3455_c0_g1_i2.p1  ORF type:complete len:686 (-),score=167.09 TRINITY_DN3455_c0_g1_i2:53-2074(-)